MKVLVVHNYYSVPGGEDIVFHAELEQLKQLLGKDHVRQYTVSNAGLTKWKAIKSIFFFNKHSREIYKIVKENKIDIVHVHNFFPLLGAGVFKAARKAGAQTVHTLHNYRWHCISGDFYRDQTGICMRCTEPGNFLAGIRYKCYRNSFLQSILAQAAFWYFRQSGTLECIDRFLVLTRFQKELVMQLGIPEKKIALKPNMLPWDSSKIQATKKGFLYVGRLDQAKGIEYLLKTWLLLPSHFQLTVIGSGILGEQLMAKYQQPNISFKGALDSVEVLQFMANAQYLIQPSLWYETFGLTIIESMSVGTPVIGFNIGTRTELIEDGKTGFITSPENLEATLLKANDFEAYQSLSQNAMNFSQLFSSTDLMNQQLAIYQSLIKI